MHKSGDSEIPPAPPPPHQPPPVTLSEVLFQGGKNVEVLPVKKEERKTSGTDTQRETSWDWLEKSGRDRGVRTWRERGELWERAESIWFQSL